MASNIDDPILGNLIWDEGQDWWNGTIDLLSGHTIELMVSFDEEKDDQAVVLTQARQWLNRLREHEPEYRRWSAERLLESRWNKEQPMTAEDISELLKVATLECSSDGSADLYWKDEDVLFYGHNIVTRLDRDGKCIEVGMQ